MKQLIPLFCLIALSAIGCGAGPQETAEAAPRIVSFKVEPSTITRGQTATVSWEIRNATSADLAWEPEAPIRGSIQRTYTLPPTGSMKVQPPVNMVYILECENKSGGICEAVSTILKVNPPKDR